LETDVDEKKIHRFLKETASFGLVVSFLLFFPLLLSAQGGVDTTERVLEELKKCQERANALNEYTLTLIKQERIRGRLNPAENIFVKWKKPLMIYMKINSGKNKGREIIYVKGRNNDKMMVSPGGILGALTIRISPESRLAFRDNRHSVAEAGMASTIRRINSTIKEDMKKPGHEIRLSYVGDEIYDGNGTIHIRVEKSSYADSTEIYIYKSSHLICALFSYDESGSLIESYLYKEIKTDVKLTDKDFDPKNEEYKF